MHAIRIVNVVLEYSENIYYCRRLFEIVGVQRENRPLWWGIKCNAQLGEIVSQGALKKNQLS